MSTEPSLFVKHNTTLKERKHERATAWTFSFSPQDIKQVRGRGSKAFVALVCGAKEVNPKQMDMCLLNPEQVAQLVDSSQERMNAVMVKVHNRKQLSVSSSRVEEDILVSQNALDQWNVPGS